VRQSIRYQRNTTIAKATEPIPSAQFTINTDAPDALTVDEAEAPPAVTVTAPPPPAAELAGPAVAVAVDGAGTAPGVPVFPLPVRGVELPFAELVAGEFVGAPILLEGFNTSPAFVQNFSSAEMTLKSDGSAVET
jgi:hypothetical protein